MVASRQRHAHGSRVIGRVICAWLLCLASPVVAYAQGAPLSDAQMVGVLLTANQAEIAAGRIALRKTQSTSLRSFATRIVNENAQIAQETSDMLQRVGAMAQRSSMSDALARQSRDDAEMLDQADEYSFAQAYLEREVEFLGRLVKTVDDFIRTTHSADVKVLLVRARPAFTLHLDQARRLRLVFERPGFGH
ncbi:conserved hypothetical protein [Burkholderia sp. 8Y]|uniref:DUF4142 domain-containing protein n=1 Tax=Burkholderia sp. 8Y TaxID=2653133 RepID=UPI0012EF1455|nr:DUF4142 domain-containing protein [Burkholderia sp. 8Y]VXC67916.1 conserved hypothetical protein [Burkholderia sp. 8Y]